MISANIKIDEYPFLKIKYPVSRENSIAKIPNRKLIKKAIVVGVIFMPGKRDNIWHEKICPSSAFFQYLSIFLILLGFPVINTALSDFGKFSSFRDSIYGLPKRSHNCSRWIILESISKKPDENDNKRIVIRGIVRVIILWFKN